MRRAMGKSQPNRNPKPGLDAVEVRSSGVHGLGLFARSKLRSGQLIGNYDGRPRSADSCAQDSRDGLTYLFSLSEGGFIDGRQGGNATRHLNHSCEPNCLAEEYKAARGKLGVRIKALRAIAQGEELFLDYSLIVDPAEQPSDYPCYCGTPTCRQTLVAPDEG
jgi:SET domain-containing protein